LLIAHLLCCLPFLFLGAFFASQKTGLCGGSAATHGLQPCAAAAPRPYNPVRGLKLSFAVKVGADFHFEIGIADFFANMLAFLY
jgi:hypothetical protein